MKIPDNHVVNLIRRLNDACYCCAICGEKYGQRRDTTSSWYVGTCNVCNRTDVPVTITRDYSYLHVGIKRLADPPENDFDRILLEYPQA